MVNDLVCIFLDFSLCIQSCVCSVQFSCSVMSHSLRLHELQHSRPPCPSPTPGVHSDSRPLSQWCHPAISSSVVPFSCPHPSQQQCQEALNQLMLPNSPVKLYMRGCIVLVRLGGSPNFPETWPLHPSYLLIISRHPLWHALFSFLEKETCFTLRLNYFTGGKRILLWIP